MANIQAIRPAQGVRNLGNLVQTITEPLRPMVDVLAKVSHAIKPYLEAVRPLLKAAQPYVEALVRHKNFVDCVGATGWLPYHTVSIEYVEACGENVSLLDQRLGKFYRHNWDDIREDIESRLDGYGISDESKATFREALDAHSAGHYRCVCRVLFPEIDREFRILFFEDGAGTISSRRMLKKLNERMTLRCVLRREAYGWILFDRLIHHLYERVDDGNRAEFADDYVPNRHASIHGLTSYSTHKHSMNMIVMADYIFQILTVVANNQLEDQLAGSESSSANLE